VVLKPHGPFLRWPGAKSRLLKQITAEFPTDFGTYYEPFLGGGSVYFATLPRVAHLSDRESGLVDTYLAVRDDVESVISALDKWDSNRSVYYETRSNYPSPDPIQSAAQFVYLNWHCWHGIYRVNRSGKFNVPYGEPSGSREHTYGKLRDASKSLQSTHIGNSDFEESLESATTGDLAFLDPPYVTSHNENGFHHYNETVFSWDDQRRLADTARLLLRRGVNVVLSNANHSSIRELYSFMEATELTRPSTVAASASKRRKVSELLLVGRPE